MALLEEKRLSITAAHALLVHLRAAQDATLLAALEERMAHDGCTADWLSNEHARQQAQLTDRLADKLVAFLPVAAPVRQLQVR